MGIFGVIIALAWLTVVSLTITSILVLLLGLRGISKSANISRLSRRHYLNLVNVCSGIGITVGIGSWLVLLFYVLPTLGFENVLAELGSSLASLIIPVIFSFPLLFGGYMISFEREGMVPLLGSIGVGVVPALIIIWLFTDQVPGFFPLIVAILAWVMSGWLVLSIWYEKSKVIDRSS